MDKERKYFCLNESPPGDKIGQRLAYKFSLSSHEDPQIVKSDGLEKYHPYKPSPNTNTIASSPESVFRVKKYMEPPSRNTLREIENEEKLREIISNQMITRLPVLPDTEKIATALNKCSKLILDITTRAVKKVFYHVHKHVSNFEFHRLHAFGILNSSQRDDLNLNAMVILLLECGGKFNKISLNDLQRHLRRQYDLLHIPNNTDKSLRGALLNIDYYHRWFLCVNKQNIARTELFFMWQTITEAVVRIAGKDFLTEIEILATSQKCDPLEIHDKDVARSIGDSIDSISTQSKKEADRLMSISQQVVDDNTLQTLSKSETHHAESCTSESFEEKQANYLKKVPLLEAEYDTKGKVKSEIASLFKALREGDVKIVESELISGTHVDVCDDSGVTPLHVACQHGHINVVELLLQHGVEVNRYGDNGVRPLHKACQHGHTDIVKLLLQHKVDANRRDNNGVTPLHVACQYGHINVVELLLQHGVDVNNWGPNGVTPLHVACQHGHTDTVELLLQHQKNVNRCDDNGVTPLHVACQHGHTDIVKLLLQHKVDANRRDNNGVTPLHVACQHGHTDIVELLLQHKVDANRCDDNGVTPLHVACQHGHINVVELLLQHGVEVNYWGPNGVTPLHVACQHGHTDTVKLLLQHGVDVNSCDNNGVTPLHVACQHGYTDIVQLLLQQTYAVVVNRRNKLGVEPLHVACQHDHTDLEESLLQHKVDVNCRDRIGVTPLHVACQHDHTDLEESLLQHEVDVNCGDHNGVTPLHVACQHGHINIVKLLLSYGALVQCCDSDGVTPLHVALQLGNMELVEVLTKMDGKQKFANQETNIKGDISYSYDSSEIDRIQKIFDKIDMQNVSVMATKKFNCNPSTSFRVKSSATDIEPIDILILSDKLEKPIVTTILENRVKITNPKIVSRESSVILGKSQQERQLTREEMITAKRIIQANSDQLFKNHRNLNIITTSNVRSKQGGEKVISELCIVLHCYCKGLIPEEEIDFPKYLKWETDQLPVDVREGFFEFGAIYNTGPSTNYHRQLKMGCAMGIRNKDLEGSVGPFLKCYGGIGFLTCAHTTCGVRNDNYHYRVQDFGVDCEDDIKVLQPPQWPQEFMQNANVDCVNYEVGKVVEAVFKPKCDSEDEISIDVGLVKITNCDRIPLRGEFAVCSPTNLKEANFEELPIFEGSVKIKPKQIDTDARIVKFGMKTHGTRGIITSNGTVVRTSIAGLRSSNQSSFVSTFQNQYEVGSITTCPIFFQGGDSGSGVFQVEKRSDKEILHLIGLAIGFTSYHSAIVTPIQAIMKVLKIDETAFTLNGESCQGATSIYSRSSQS